MVQTTNKNLEIVKNFKKKAEKIINLQKLVFFGSRAKGIFSEESDFDLLLVSKDFENQPFYKRPVELYLNWKEAYPLELMCYTPEELKRKSQNPLSLVSEALKTGITI
ncbi:MAG: nucleotidyltransferase domain-containing protein [archaeon]